nr:hypothetical protein [Gemmatimonadaceae bacterium]
DLRLLDRCLAGRCSSDEQAALQRWIAVNPANSLIIEAFRAEWKAGWVEQDVDAAWNRICARTAINVADTGTSTPRRPIHLLPISRRRSFPVTAAIAAAAALMFGGGYGLWKLQRSPPAIAAAEEF